MAKLVFHLTAGVEPTRSTSALSEKCLSRDTWRRRKFLLLMCLSRGISWYVFLCLSCKTYLRKKWQNFHVIKLKGSFITNFFQKTVANMEAPGPAMIQHLQAISREAPSCTLITSMGERVEVKLLLLVDSEPFPFYQVQSFLLAAISPYLASLLSQVDFLFWSILSQRWPHGLLL